MHSPFAALTAPASGVDVDPITERQRDYLRSLMLQKAQLLGRDTTEYGEQVDGWLDKLSKSGASVRIEETKQWLEDHHAAARATGAESALEDIEDGFYELPDGMIVKVIHAVHASGRQYGKAFDPEHKTWEKIVGIVHRVREAGKRIDTDQERAAQLGQLYGICMCCGLELTDETSIERGIGPVCATKRGW